MTPGVRVLSGLLLVIIPTLSAGGCRRAPATEETEPPQRPPLARGAQSHDEWIAEWASKLPVTASLKMRPRTERSLFYATRNCRAYVVTIEVKNNTPYGMRQNDPAFLFESAGPPIAGGKPDAALAVAGGRFAELPFADYSGAFEYRGDPWWHARQFEFHGLANGEVRWLNGQILRRTLDDDALLMITDEEAVETVFRSAPAGTSAVVNTDVILAVMVKRERLDRATYVTPELVFTLGPGQEARFRYLLEFSPVPGDWLAPWSLTATRLVSLNADGLLPLVSDRSAPAWRRVFATEWAVAHARDAVLPALAGILGADPREHPSVRQVALGAVEALAYAPALPLVTATLANLEEPKGLRRAALRAAGAVGDRSLVSLLSQAAAGSNAKNAELAVEALGRLSDKSGTATLLDMLRDARAAKLHEQVGSALKKAADPGAVAPLIQLARDRSARGRVAAVRALGGRTDAQSVEVLKDLCGGKEAQVRAAACRALAETCPEGAEAVLSAALMGPDAKVADETADALESQRSAISDRLLNGALTGPHASVFAKAVRALAARKQPVRDLVFNALSSADQKFRAAAVDLLGVLDDAPSHCLTLASLLGDSSAAVREEAADMCGLQQCANALPQLERLLRRTDVERSYVVVTAVVRIRDKRAIPVLKWMLTEGSSDLRPRAAVALGAYADPDTIDLLALGLMNGNSELQRAAAFALARFPDRRAQAALLKALKVGDAYLRECAALALERATGLDHWQNLAAWEKALARPEPAAPASKPGGIGQP